MSMGFSTLYLLWIAFVYLTGMVRDTKKKKISQFVYTCDGVRCLFVPA